MFASGPKRLCSTGSYIISVWHGCRSNNVSRHLTRNRTEYDLRTGANITTPAQRTTTYQMSFIPESIRDWNKLDVLTKSVTSIESFKYKLKTKIGYKPNPLFYHNNSKTAINQSRIRMGLSALSSQRFNYKHIDSLKFSLKFISLAWIPHNSWSCRGSPQRMYNRFVSGLQ